MALSDTQQGYLTLVSAILIALGGATVPAGDPWYVGLTLALAGAVGLAIKEFLGAKPSAPPAPSG